MYNLKKQMVGLNGLEPTTSPLSGVRSNHLSYRPISLQMLNHSTKGDYQSQQHFSKKIKTFMKALKPHNDAGLRGIKG